MISAEARKIGVCDTSLCSGNPVLQQRWVLNKSIKRRATVVGGCFPMSNSSGKPCSVFCNIQKDLIWSLPSSNPPSDTFPCFQFLVLSGNVGSMSCRPREPRSHFILILKPPSCPLHSRERGFVQNNLGSAWHKRSSGEAPKSLMPHPVPLTAEKNCLRVPAASLEHLRSRTRPSRGWESAHGWESLQGQSCKRSLMEQKYS